MLWANLQCSASSASPSHVAIYWAGGFAGEIVHSATPAGPVAWTTHLVVARALHNVGFCHKADISRSGFLPCKLTLNPVSPIANPCCNRASKARANLD